MGQRTPFGYDIIITIGEDEININKDKAGKWFLLDTYG